MSFASLHRTSIHAPSVPVGKPQAAIVIRESALVGVDLVAIECTCFGSRVDNPRWLACRELNANSFVRFLARLVSTRGQKDDTAIDRAISFHDRHRLYRRFVSLQVFFQSRAGFFDCAGLEWVADFQPSPSFGASLLAGASRRGF